MPTLFLTLLMSTLAVLRGVSGSSGGGGDDPAPAAPPTPASGPDTTPDDPPPIDAEPPEVDNPGGTPAPGPTDDEPDATPLEPGVSAVVMTGRVTTLDLPAGLEADAVRITGLPEHGNVTVNPDNTLSLVLTGSDYTGDLSFTYEVRAADGTITGYRADLTVEPGLQDGGWGTGAAIYMLETDADDDVIVETGDAHRKVYISGSEDALTAADIAALEGLDPSQITSRWLADHPDYGGSEGMALAPDIGMPLWYRITGQYVEPNSNWLLFERGYVYEGIGNVAAKGTHGESELHPVHITSWGEGDRPVLDTDIFLGHPGWSNIVFSGLDLPQGMEGLNGGVGDWPENLILDDIRLSGEPSTFQKFSGLTIRNSEIVDVYRESPTGDGDWTSADTSGGLYVASVTGLLLEGTLVDYTGWREGYDPNLSGDSPQPPTMFSHNIYLQVSNLDVTMRDTISMRGASFGAQVRSGGLIEDNVFLDNNIGLNVMGGDFYDRGDIGNYSFVTGNLVTSAGYKIAEGAGAVAWGVFNDGYLAALQDNIIAHLADPNNPDEIAEKTGGGSIVTLRSSKTPYYDDTIIYNWGSTDIRTDGLDTGVLDQTTIQNFAAALTGNSDATIEDLANYLRALSDSPFDDTIGADDILRYFQQGFGIYEAERTAAETVTFVPSDLADGVRWDNRENWSTGDLPGTVAGDSVDLNGNWVYFGGTETVQDLDFGSGGRLIFNHGKLTVAGETSAGFRGAEAEIHGAGQFWMNGYGDGDRLSVDLTGGRFANTGDVTGAVDLSASGGQAILATGGGSYAVTSGSLLEIASGEARVGFDGDDGGTALLGFGDDATLRFAAGGGTLGKIGEFRSGAYGDAPDVQSGIDLGGGLEIDLAELAGTGTHTLISADEIIGAFGATDITGLGARDAEIVVDYTTDTVRLVLASGNGAVSVSTVGAEADVSAGDEALWEMLTANQGTWDDALPPPEDEEEFWEAA